MLNNKIVFVTGATAGIGEACAKDFAREGANLILCARRIESLKKLSDSIIKDYGVKVYYFQLDVRERESVKKNITSLPD
ncbi:MAG: SDR family NAD(P)-dependent oxidoreductase, partial [Ignavibacteriaceae bacterium]